MKKFLMMVALIFLLSSSSAHAEVQTFVGHGEYLMTEETIDFAKEQAELEAERSILESVCVEVRAESKMIDQELDNDEIITICAGIIHVIDTKFNFVPDPQGILVRATVTAEIDIEETVALLEQEIKNRM